MLFVVTPRLKSSAGEADSTGLGSAQASARAPNPPGDPADGPHLHRKPVALQPALDTRTRVSRAGVAGGEGPPQTR